MRFIALLFGLLLSPISFAEEPSRVVHLSREGDHALFIGFAKPGEKSIMHGKDLEDWPKTAIDSCERLALMAMSDPQKYTLRVVNARDFEKSTAKETGYTPAQNGRYSVKEYGSVPFKKGGEDRFYLTCALDVAVPSPIK